MMILRQTDIYHRNRVVTVTTYNWKCFKQKKIFIVTYWVNLSLNGLIKHLSTSFYRRSCFLFILFSLRCKTNLHEEFLIIFAGIWNSQEKKWIFEYRPGWLLIKVWWCLKTSLVTQASKVPLPGALQNSNSSLLMKAELVGWKANADTIQRPHYLLRRTTFTRETTKSCPGKYSTESLWPES